jgi:hypothetical protein
VVVILCVKLVMLCALLQQPTVEYAGYMLEVSELVTSAMQIYSLLNPALISTCVKVQYSWPGTGPWEFSLTHSVAADIELCKCAHHWLWCHYTMPPAVLIGRGYGCYIVI